MATSLVQTAARFLITILWFSSAALGVSARASSDLEIERAIRSALEQRHPTDTADWWRALGSNAPAVIERMYANSTQTYHRLRLIQAMGWFQEASAVQFEKKVAQGATDDVIRNAAIRSVGTSAGAKEEEWIAGFLKHSDAQTRYATAETLNRLGTPSAQARLRAYLAQEPATWIGTKLAGQLPMAIQPMRPAATSEERLNPEWVGRWTGVWVEPSPTGIVTRKAQLEVEPAGSQDWVARIKMGKKGQLVQTGEFKTRDCRGSRALGYFLAGGRAEQGVGFEGELSTEKGRLVLRLKIPSEAATLVLTR